MPQDDSFDFDKVLDDAEKETLDQFSSRIAKITKLTEAEVKEICPTIESQEAFNELVQIVNSKTAENEQKAQLLANASRMGSVLLAIAKKVILPI